MQTVGICLGRDFTTRDVSTFKWGLSAKLANVKNVPISWLINREIIAMEETTDVTPDTPPARER